MTQPHFFSKHTQVYWTCKALLEGRTISHRTEIREIRGRRLAAIIHRLKRDFGWPILAERRGPQNIAHYRVKPGTRADALRYPPSAAALMEREGQS